MCTYAGKWWYKKWCIFWVGGDLNQVLCHNTWLQAGRHDGGLSAASGGGSLQKKQKRSTASAAQLSKGEVEEMRGGKIVMANTKKFSSNNWQPGVQTPSHRQNL